MTIVIAFPLHRTKGPYGASRAIPWASMDDLPDILPVFLGPWRKFLLGLLKL